jgi:hypothetical protein
MAQHPILSVVSCCYSSCPEVFQRFRNRIFSSANDDFLLLILERNYFVNPLVKRYLNKVVNFSLAINKSYRKKDGERVEQTTFFDCAYWISTKIAGLYPCAEGAGYAGGIVSAAIDGINLCLSKLQ